MRVTVIDLAERGPSRDLFKRKMSPGFANIDPNPYLHCEVVAPA